MIAPEILRFSRRKEKSRFKRTKLCLIQRTVKCQSILPIQIFHFPLHGLLNMVKVLKILSTFNIWTMHVVTSSDAEILHDLTSCCGNSARCNVKCCRNSARCIVKCCNTSWHWKKLMYTLSSQLFITILLNKNLRVNLDFWAKSGIRFTSDKSKQQPFVELT